MPSLNYTKFGKQVCDAMRMARKINPGIKLAEKAFGRGIVKTLLERKSFMLEDFTPRQRKIIKKLTDLKYGPLVYRAPSGKYKVKPKVGEVLALSYVNADERCKKIAMAVRNECWRRGVMVSMKGANDADTKRYFKTAPEDMHVELPNFILEKVKNIDATISIGDKQDPEWTKGFEGLLLLGAPSGQKLHGILDERKTRWCGVGFPVKMNKRSDYIVSPKKYESVYINSIKETYSKRTQKLCKYYYNALMGGDKVHITANDGTDLKFSIRGRPILIDDGVIDDADMQRGDVGLNIPSGEAFIAPLEHSANGRIFFDYVNIPGFGHIKKGLWLTFKDGKVVKYETDAKGKKIFKKFLDSNTGEKDRIAELGIGTNMAARFIGTIIVDEKIYGTIHIAIGTNMGAYHGKNKASSHLDMIKQMKGKDGNMVVDDRVVMSNGEPVGKV
jgi:leucyl aminopeptidase (aminopeptidase T)